MDFLELLVVSVVDLCLEYLLSLFQICLHMKGGSGFRNFFLKIGGGGPGTERREAEIKDRCIKVQAKYKKDFGGNG